MFTSWKALSTTKGYDIFMWAINGAGPTQPWSAAKSAMNSVNYQTENNWNGDFGGYKNPAADS